MKFVYRKRKQRKRTQRKRTQRYRNRQTQRHHGGEAIAYGGYGCVFYPSLLCEKDTVLGNVPVNQKQISKLMKNKNAQKEYQQVQRWKPLLQKIPHYQRYFLVDNWSLCRPHMLRSSDLQNFDEKCKTWEETSATIQNDIKKGIFSIIRMPYGGVPLDDIWKRRSTSVEVPSIDILLASLGDLFENGILPMNQTFHLYHTDIKGDNILVDRDVATHEWRTRLIDWGVAFSRGTGTVSHPTYPWFGARVSYLLYKQYINFNVPYESILFNDYFVTSLDTFFFSPTTSYQTASLPAMEAWTRDYWRTFQILLERGDHHLHNIKILLNWTEHTDKDDIDGFVTRYLAKLLYRLVVAKNRSATHRALTTFFQTSFLPRIDPHGFLWCLTGGFSYLFEDGQGEKKYPRTLAALRELFRTHLLEPQPDAFSPLLMLKRIKALPGLYREDVRGASVSAPAPAPTTKATSRNKRTHRDHIAAAPLAKSLAVPVAPVSKDKSRVAKMAPVVQ